jgi:hypothetical protein
MWKNISEKPEAGKKVVAVFNDGFNAEVCYITEDGYISSNGVRCCDFEEHFSMWAYLDDSFEMWYVRQGVMPLPPNEGVNSGVRSWPTDGLELESILSNGDISSLEYNKRVE